MGKDATAWRELVEPHFGFVAAFGFEAVDLDDELLLVALGPVPFADRCHPHQQEQRVRPV